MATESMWIGMFAGPGCGKPDDPDEPEKTVKKTVKGWEDTAESS